MNKSLLELRNKMKKRKPSFHRQDSHKKARLDTSWRKSRGDDSKMGQNLKGYRKSPSKGYRSPREVRGLNPLGLKEVIVNSIQDIKKLKNGEGAVISRTLGLRKTLILVKETIKDSINIVNIKDPQKFIKEIEDEIQNKKKAKEEKIEEKTTKLKEKEKKSEEAKKENLAEKISEEERKEQEKKEKDKILIKKA